MSDNILEVRDLKMHFSDGSEGLFGGKKNISTRSTVSAST